MRKPVSLITKVMMLLTCIILLLAIAISMVLITQSDRQLNEQNRTLQVQNQARYQMLLGLLNERLAVWVETLTQTHNSNIGDMTKTVIAAQNFAQFQWNINDIWFIDPNGVVRSGDVERLPFLTERLVKQTRGLLRPVSAISCENHCRQLMSVPILLENQQTAVLLIDSTMQELMALLSKSSGARVTLVQRLPAHEAGVSAMHLTEQLAPDTRVYFEELLAQMRRQAHPLEQLIEHGVHLTGEHGETLVTLLPLEQSRAQGHYILFAHDISALVKANAIYQRWVLVVAVMAFFITALCMYWLLNRYRIKLTRLSQRLPLLAEHRFREFQDRKLPSRHSGILDFSDEVDVLEDTAEELAVKLENLELEAASNTAQLEKMAMFDALTGLPNRNMLTYHIEKQLALSHREPKLVALMFIDLDDFKKVNDSHGHGMGDNLLKMAATRITQALRESDVAARFGGDEFVVLLSSIAERDHIDIVAKKLIEAFNIPMTLEEIPFYMSISIGVAISNDTQTSAVELLRHADIAMYEAKMQQGSAYRMYDTSMNLDVMRRVELEAEARTALREDQFSLALQPQLDLKHRKLVGFEALLRWEHPEKGQIAPSDFIPLLEHTSFMLQLDYWVVSRAIRLLHELRHNGYPELKLAINLSASQFLDPTLPQYLDTQLDKHQIPAELLELELTETVLVSDMGRATVIMREIQALGCQISIDDFGTGYSSLSYLKALPVNAIKIDRSFIAGMLDSRDDRNIVYSTIAMVRNLGKSIVAEGIELPAQYEMLCHFACDVGQGYLISRPVPEAKLWSFLQRAVAGNQWQLPLPVFTEEDYVEPQPNKPTF